MIAGLQLNRFCSKKKALTHLQQTRKQEVSHIQSENVLDALVDLGQRKVPVPVGVKLQEELVPQSLLRVALSDRKLRSQLTARE